VDNTEGEYPEVSQLRMRDGGVTHRGKGWTGTSSVLSRREGITNVQEKDGENMAKLLGDERGKGS